VTKLAQAGSQLLYSTYLGGLSWEAGSGVAVDASGSAIVAGATESGDFPIQDPVQGAYAGARDAFAARLSPSGGQLLNGTYLGGTGEDAASCVAQGADLGIYISGLTASADFPTWNPIQGSYGGGECDAFAVKLSSAGSQMVYGTFLGGSSRDVAEGIAVDAAGSAFVAGTSSSADFPMLNPYQSGNAGQNDAFIAKLSPAGTGVSEPWSPPCFCLEITGATPNPFGASLHISVYASTAALVQVSVFCISGRRVADLGAGLLQPGLHSYIWDAGGTADGVYFVRAVSEAGESSSRRVLLLR
jgi:hypothetical protein